MSRYIVQYQIRKTAELPEMAGSNKIDRESPIHNALFTDSLTEARAFINKESKEHPNRLYWIHDTFKYSDCPHPSY